MNSRLAAGSGVGLIVGTLIGVIVDAMFSTEGMALIAGGALGISLGAGFALAMGGDSEDQRMQARKRRQEAALKYRPKDVKLLLVAEAPPADESRYFYFEDVTTNDWLFRGVVEVLFGETPDRSDKAKWLKALKDRGMFVVDMKLDPVDDSDLEAYVPDLVSRCQLLRPEHIIVIKVTVYDAAYEELRAAGLPVVEKRIPFPSTGQQGRFREEFKEALEMCGIGAA